MGGLEGLDLRVFAFGGCVGVWVGGFVGGRWLVYGCCCYGRCSVLVARGGWCLGMGMGMGRNNRCLFLGIYILMFVSWQHGDGDVSLLFSCQGGLVGRWGVMGVLSVLGVRSEEKRWEIRWMVDGGMWDVRFANESIGFVLREEEEEEEGLMGVCFRLRYETECDGV